MGYIRWPGNGLITVIEHGKPAYMLKVERNNKISKLPYRKRRANRKKN